MKTLAVIPARLHSTRLPEKVLEKIGDRILLQWVYQDVLNAGVFDEVIIATDSEKVLTAAKSFGAKAEMTAVHHQSGSDRVGEVAERHPEFDAIINIQADQLCLSKTIFESLIAPFKQNKGVEMTTLATPLQNRSETNNPSIVKVVWDRKGRALYFSRASIPYLVNSSKVPAGHHLGLYAYSRKFLKLYGTLSPTPLEQAESLEQLRVLEHGYSIQVSLVSPPGPFEINTPEDLKKARELKAMF